MEPASHRRERRTSSVDVRAPVITVQARPTCSLVSSTRRRDDDDRTCLWRSPDGARRCLSLRAAKRRRHAPERLAELLAPPPTFWAVSPHRSTTAAPALRRASRAHLDAWVRDGTLHQARPAESEPRGAGATSAALRAVGSAPHGWMCRRRGCRAWVATALVALLFGVTMGRGASQLYPGGRSTSSAACRRRRSRRRPARGDRLEITLDGVPCMSTHRPHRHVTDAAALGHPRQPPCRCSCPTAHSRIRRRVLRFRAAATARGYYPFDMPARRWRSGRLPHGPWLGDVGCDHLGVGDSPCPTIPTR
jgi:hypothetical protein